MKDASTEAELNSNERAFAAELSTAANAWHALVRRAMNNELGVTERVLAKMNGPALEWLYAILGEASKKLLAQLTERQHSSAEALERRLGGMPICSLMIPTDKAYTDAQLGEVRERTRQALTLIEDLYGALNPPQVDQKPAAPKSKTRSP